MSDPAEPKTKEMIVSLLRELANDFESGKIRLKNAKQSRSFDRMYRGSEFVDFAPPGEYGLDLSYENVEEALAYQKLIASGLRGEERSP